MNRLLIGSAVLAALAATPAFAADMAVKAPMYVKAAPVSSWTGWYAGVNLGLSGAEDPANENTVTGAGYPGGGAGRELYGTPENFHTDAKGLVGGGQFGYNWQFDPHVLFGLETDIQGSGIKGDSGCILSCAGTNQTLTTPGFTNVPVTFRQNDFTTKTSWFGTVRGRVGYTEGPALVYFTGGLAYGNVTRGATVIGSFPNGGGNSFTGSYSASSTKTGWTLGGGAEAKLVGNWSVKLEYLYVDLGKTTDSFNTYYARNSGGPIVAGTVAGIRTDTSHARDNIFRVGVNYAFNNFGGWH